MLRFKYCLSENGSKNSRSVANLIAKVCQPIKLGYAELSSTIDFNFVVAFCTKQDLNVTQNMNMYELFFNFFLLCFRFLQYFRAAGGF